MEQTVEKKLTEKTPQSPDYTMGVIAYIAVIGLIIAYVTNQEKKDEFVSYHIRQSLGLILTGFASWIITYFLPFFLSMTLSSLFGLGILVLWVFGLVNALNKKKAPVPVLGEKYDEWFKNI